MATVHMLVANQPVEAQRQPIAGAEAFGLPQAEAAGHVANIFKDIQEHADVAESTNLVGQAKSGMNATLTDAKINNLDPEGYKQQATQGIQAHYDVAIESASNNIVKRNVQARLQDTLGNTQAAVELQYFKKKGDIAEAHTAEYLDTASKDAAMTTDPALREAIYKSVGAEIGKLQPWIGEKGVTEKLIAFHNKAEGQRADSAMVDNPYQFLADVKDGKYSEMPNAPERIKAGIALADRRDQESLRTQTAHQNSLFAVMAEQAANGKLDRTLISPALESNDITFSQAQHLWGLTGNPTFLTSPGGVEQIMRDRAIGGFTSGANAAAERQLRQLLVQFPQDQHVTSALRQIDNDRKSGIVEEHAAETRARTTRNEQLQQGINELDNTMTPDGRKFYDRYKHSVIDMNRKKYESVINTMRDDVLYHGMSRQDAVEKAKKTLNPPQTGAPPKLNKMLDDAGN